MHLDTFTMSAVSISITAVLGLVLLFTWARERECAFVGWWGLSLLILSAAIVGMVAMRNAMPLMLGQAAMIFAEAIKWRACREFAHRSAHFAWTLSGSAFFIVAASSGLLDSFASRLVVVCALMALYNFAAALELSRTSGEQLMSRLPAVVLLVVTAFGFLSWVPLSISMPMQEANAVFSSEWFPVVVLGTLLIRIALAFVVLSMDKERQELEQRVDALTDSLTGLPNRRALFEAADLLAQSRSGKAEPVSVLLFDLDHFKTTNDTYGHEVGDQVLRLFAETVSARLSGRSIVGRLGGEEFAAILPGVGPVAAVTKAEAIRRAFAKSAVVVDDLAIGATVSIGAASHLGRGGDLGALFRRADAALYAAKRAGRNRVELLGVDETSGFETVRSPARAMRRNNVDEPPAAKLSA